jgi:hypothetical protein
LEIAVKEELEKVWGFYLIIRREVKKDLLR